VYYRLATGLVAGGAVAGVVIAILSGTEAGDRFLRSVSIENGLLASLGEYGYYLMGVLFFAALAFILYRVALKK